MIADGYVIDDEIVDRVVDAILDHKGPFKALSVAHQYQAEAVPWLLPRRCWGCRTPMPCYEAANRTLQNLRKAGKITTINNRTWKVI